MFTINSNYFVQFHGTIIQTVLVLSGVSTAATVRQYAYQPTEVLDGVGDIVKKARKNREKA